VVVFKVASVRKESRTDVKFAAAATKCGELEIWVGTGRMGPGGGQAERANVTSCARNRSRRFIILGGRCYSRINSDRKCVYIY
jgi:hypothetical protein